MGYHWYAFSRELIEIEGASEVVERRLAAAADKAAVDSVVAEREVLFEREAVARLAMQRRGESVTVADARAWPADVQQHLGALGASSDEGCSILDLLGWGRDYYVEALDASGVRMRSFSRNLRAINLEPAQAQELAQELLRYASNAKKPKAANTN